MQIAGTIVTFEDSLHEVIGEAKNYTLSIRNINTGYITHNVPTLFIGYPTTLDIMELICSKEERK